MIDIERQVKAIIVEKLGVKESVITDASDFEKDLGADSLDSVELLMAFEEKFGIEIKDEEANELRTVGRVIQYIAERIKTKNEH